MLSFSSRNILVVEGVNDTKAVKSAIDCETIETGGKALADASLAKIRKARERSKVFVFTDSDKAGRSIRRKVHQKAGPDWEMQYFRLFQKRAKPSLNLPSLKKFELL